MNKNQVPSVLGGDCRILACLQGRSDRIIDLPKLPGRGGTFYLCSYRHLVIESEGQRFRAGSTLTVPWATTLAVR